MNGKNPTASSGSGGVHHHQHADDPDEQAPGTIIITMFRGSRVPAGPAAGSPGRAGGTGGARESSAAHGRNPSWTTVLTLPSRTGATAPSVVIVSYCDERSRWLIAGPAVRTDRSFLAPAPRCWDRSPERSSAGWSHSMPNPRPAVRPIQTLSLVLSWPPAGGGDRVGRAGRYRAPDRLPPSARIPVIANQFHQMARPLRATPAGRDR